MKKKCSQEHLTFLGLNFSLGVYVAVRVRPMTLVVGSTYDVGYQETL